MEYKNSFLIIVFVCSILGILVAVLSNDLYYDEMIKDKPTNIKDNQKKQDNQKNKNENSQNNEESKNIDQKDKNNIFLKIN